MKKICICGNFARHGQILEGQSIKTRSVYNALSEIVGKEKIVMIDTSGGNLSNLFAIIKLFLMTMICDNIIILPAQKALKVFPLMVVLADFFFHHSTHYVVIGGWLYSYLVNRRVISSCLKRFTGIYVETQSLKKQLLAQGFKNVLVMPNFRTIKEINHDKLKKKYQEPYKVCTFSRVMQDKGIGDAVNAINQINNEWEREVFHLDIYGPIEKGEEQWFDKLQKDFGTSITYQGNVDYKRAIETLSDYFALIFPTRFYTEGLPGTIIDAFGAGVPVIYSCWEHAPYILSELTGIGYEFQNVQDLVRVLKRVAERPEMLTNLKANCIQEEKKYDSKNAIGILLERLK